MTRGVGGESPANVATYLKGIDYPANKQDLLQHARQNGAEQDVVDVLERMPEQQYGNMADVMKGYGEAH
ncbi:MULTISPECIES: DUF2795 domain-containing protein [Stutzerimonas]|jgi:hypothetical protein|uniref:DUF2795 domain-containing protein n=2 Tax=Stutzerimonas balearica TaxID=74829 RepID=A0A8D3Y4I1_9GAMM|nr:DUF2795 domain-containing protein [Stutzerimonas balearica]KIL03399.1 hypothetical protein QX25_17565 [Stutzerimonas stutzeri]MBB62241.1 DUF2795 domain-containing protein [Pseudomonas sp.]MBZ5754143.1 DUF2795 domain-containing protein [Pseudomonas sp. S5(2021)]WIX02634.1 DUF2795 domain-containing protein [Pseudomonas sp. AR5]AJE17096.1 hypothetical protein CL52_19335 [Stutzerimonas balearica DSM 6083]